MTARPGDDNLRASLFMVLAMALFALEDVIVKRAAASLPVGQILILLGVAGSAVLVVAARLRGRPALTRAVVAGPAVARNAAELVGTGGFMLALALLPLSTVSAILQATPLVVTMGAALVLGERVGWRRWTAILAGLAGVIMILRPGAEGSGLATLLAVLAVGGFAGRDLATRGLPATVGNLEVAIWGFGVLVPSGLVVLAFGPPPVLPAPATLAELGLAVILGLLAYFAVTTAVRGGEIGAVAPFRYSRLLFGLLFGIAVFGERPDALMLAGSALVVGSGLFSLARERRLARDRGPRAPAPSRGAGQGL
ncbi:MAG: DMT family transporter [Rhodobacteraceae bacterium]|nr:DMT family transporter [Paracoccaceae bacterium]